MNGTTRCNSVRVVMVRWSLLAFLLLAACWPNYWGRRPVDQPTLVDPDDPMWIWSRGGVEKWHAVVITQDSVSGILFETSRKCARCRRSIPRVQVDSMKHGYRTLPENVTDVLGPPTLIILAEYAVGLAVHWLR